MGNTPLPLVTSWRRLMSYTLSTLLVLQPVMPAVAAGVQVVNGATKVDEAGNGVPVVNIATPNQAGVSHNQYQNFNVGTEGLILNNSTDRLTQSQLGGIIQNNPNLKAGQEAKAIINEVTSANRSQLNGYLEVAGKGASVMVANPYGITCNGCGFINTPNATLTTGKPVLGADGTLQSLDVTQGAITIEGKGLDASQSGYFSLISRATDINAQLNAQDLTVIAGANRIDASGKVTPTAGSGDTPRVAIDTGALGGMYANRIRLVSSDKGVGVNLGNINARQGDMQLDASGKMALRNSAAAGALVANAQEMQLAGNHHAQSMTLSSISDMQLQNASLASNGNLSVTSGGLIQTVGTQLTSGQDAKITGVRLTSDTNTRLDAKRDAAILLSQDGQWHGQLTAGQDAQLTSSSSTFTQQGKITANRNATFSGKQLSNHGDIQTQGNLSLNLDIFNNTGQALSGGVLAISAQNTDLSGTLSAQQDLTFTGNSLHLNQGGQLLAGQKLDLTASSLRIEGEANGAQSISLNSALFTSTQNSVLTSDGDIVLHHNEATIDGLIAAKGALTLTADRLTTGTDAQLQSQRDMALTLTQSANLQGTQAAKGKLTINAARLDHSGNSTGSDIRISSSALNQQGSLLAEQALTLVAADLINRGDILGDSLTLSASGELNNQTQGKISAGRALALNSGSFFNTGQILSQGDAALNSKTFSQNGTLAAERISLTADTLQNDGILQGNSALTLNTAALSNLNKGEIVSRGALMLSIPTLTNAGLLMADSLLITSQTLTNSGTLQGAKGLEISATTLNNQANGRLLSGALLALDAQLIHNAGVIQGDNVSLSATDFNNSGSALGSTALNASVSNILSNTGLLLSHGGMQLQATTLNNDGSLLSEKNILLQGKTIDNSGEISGVDGLSVTLQNGLTQQASGKLQSNGSTNIIASRVDNAGQVQARALTLTATDLDNSGTLQARETLTLALTGDVQNRTGGVILSDGELQLNAAMFSNDGVTQGTGSANFNFSQSAGNQGSLLSGGLLNLNAPTFSNTGWLQSGNLDFTVASTLNNSGTMMAINQATLGGNALNNSGTLQAASLHLNQVNISNDGTLFASRLLALSSQNITNSTAAKLFSAGSITLGSNALTQQGQIVALGDITLALLSDFTQNGTLAAGNTLQASTTGGFTQNGTVQGQSVALSSTGSFSNQATLTGGNSAFMINAGSISQSDNGSLQSGGDVSLISRGAITNSGLIGTIGNLLMSAAATLTNSALLYSASDMTLFADRISNLKGNILAGNSLWMMKDASGNANTEIINRSGNIETTNGDITIKTGHLLNEREGLTVNMGDEDAVSQSYPWLTSTTADVPFSYLDFSNGHYGHYRVDTGCANSCAGAFYMYTGAYKNSPGLEFAVSRSQLTVNSDGSAAGRIVSGRDLILSANVLDNNASNILVARNAALSGSTLNNQSWFESTQTRYQTYVYYIGTVNGSPQQYATESIYSTGGYSDSGAPDFLRYIATGETRVETITGDAYRAVIQAGGNVYANFTNDISNTTTTANAGGISYELSAPTLNTLSAPTEFAGAPSQDLASASSADIGSPQWRDHILDVILAGGTALNDGASINLDDYPLPASNSGYFVVNADPQSPYLIVTNPKLDSLGQLDNSLFNEIYAMQGMTAPVAPRETDRQFTDENSFIGSAYFLERLNLRPDYDYRFLGDAAFDTRYVSNALINTTGSRYINGFGSDLAQMQYLMDNAAGAQQSLGLAFGVALTSAQIASLDKSLLWWENVVVDGKNVLVPKLYLSPKDVAPATGSVIAGNNVQLAGGSISNSGSTMQANTGLYVSSQSTFENLNSGLMKTGGSLSLFALGDISNIDSTISGQSVSLVSFDGSILNQTLTDQWSIAGKSGRDTLAFSHTEIGDTASITADDSLTMYAGKNIDITGANLNAGSELAIQALGDINITANQTTEREQHHSRGKNTLTESSDTQAGSMSAGGSLTMQAGHDLNISASQVAADGDVTLKAANDINLQTQEQSAHSKTNNSEQRLDLVDNTTLNAGGSLTLVAGRDLNSQAASLSADGNATLAAGRNVNLNAAEISSYSESHGKKKQQIDEQIRQQGTNLTSGGDTRIQAGQDVTFNGAQVDATGDLTVTAGRDITLNSVTESDYSFFEQTKTSGGIFSKTTTHTVREDYATHEQGSQLGGDNISMMAGHDLNVNGSNVVGDHDVSLLAGDDINVLASTEEQSVYRLDEKKKSGLFSGGGLGFTLGTTETKHRVNEDGTTQSQSASSIGSLGGDVTMMAGNNVHVSGSDVISAEDMLISGKNVQIDPGQDALHRKETFEQKSTGLNIALSGTAGAAVNSGYTAAQSAHDDSSGRMATLDGMKAGLSGYQAYQGTQIDGNNSGGNSFIGISASLGHQESRSELVTDQHAATGSSVIAGGNATVEARDGDLNVIGSKVKSDGDLRLFATDDINLLAADNTQTTTGKNSSAGGDIGVSFGASGDKAGLSIFADVNAAAGKNHGDGTTWTNTEVGAGDNFNINAGNDLNIIGAQVSGEQIAAEIGRNLTIESVQDTDHYNSTQQSAAAGGSFTWGGGGGSGYISLTEDNMNADYASVTDQSGLFAGGGGFDITVGNHTQLNGGVIASDAASDKNHLDTGTLGWNDIHNKADYSVDGSSASMSSGGNTAPQFMGNMANGMLAGLNDDGSASGTTGSAIADGAIVIRNKEAQKQDVATLSRDTDNAHSTLEPIFDAAKEQRRIDENRAIAQIGSQVADIVRTEGKINAQEAAKNPDNLTAAKAALEAEGKTPTDADIAKRAYDTALNNYGTGSDKQQAIQAITAAVQGLTGGDWGSAVAGAAAPYMAEFIKTHTAEGAERIISHAIAGAVVAEMQGGNTAAGAAGAGLSAAGAKYIAEALYPDKDIKDLSEEEKQGVVALATLASGIAGGVIGGDVSSGIDGAKGGKNEVENNYLNDKDIKTFTENYAAAKTDAEKEQVLADLKKRDAENQKQALSTGISIADQKGALADLKALAASPECTAQCQELAAYSISELESVANNTQLHENNLNKGILASVIIALTVDKPLSSNSTSGLSSLTKEQQQLINNAEYITTAKGIQNPFPRDLNEKVLWNGVKANPSAGEVLKGMNKDPRFPTSAGFQKMQVSHELPDGSNITIHYQYNSNTGKAYDMKIVTPQTNPLQPGPSLKGK